MKFNPIGWCHFTINFWWGCTEKSPACAFCYARDIAARWSQKLFGFKVAWGDGQKRGERLQEARREALALNRSAQRRGVRYRVFANSMSDWLDSEVPADWLAFLLETIRLTPNLDWLLLTKRPEKWNERSSQVASLLSRTQDPQANPELLGWLADWKLDSPPENVWVGATVEDQTRANLRIPHLLAIPAKVRFLSCEPLLGPVDFSLILLGTKFAACEGREHEILRGKLPDFPWLDWVIAGGESGIKARPSHPDWFRSLRDQCVAAGVAFYFKQWGEFVSVSEVAVSGPHFSFPDGATVRRVGNKRAGRVLDGVEHSAFPKS